MNASTEILLSKSYSTLLKGERLRKSFIKNDASVDALSGVDIEVTQGKIIGVLGPNGAGKTTLINLLLGFKQPDSGNATLFDNTSASLHSNKEMRAKLGVTVQHSVLPPLLSFSEIYSYIATLFPNPRPLDDIVSRLGLSDKLHTLTKDLSGGQQQRIVLGVALIGNPDLLVLDEPTSQLDPQARRAVWDLLLEQKKKEKSVLITTHQMEEAERLCDEIIILDKGKIKAQGSPMELINQYCPEKSIQFYIQDVEVLNEITHVQIETFNERDRVSVRLQPTDFSHTMNQLTELEKQNKLNLDGMKIDRQNLEDVFLTITGRRIRS